MRNPYIAGSPITGSEMFFGREDVFAFIRQTLIGQHRDNILVIYGQRRTGKTSILYQMRSQLDTHYLCIFIDLHGLALEGLSGFLWELANHIKRVLRREYHIDLLALDRTQFMNDPRNAFEEDFLDHLWPVIGNRHILLMLDEAIRLQEQVRSGKLEKDVFEYLRHLMQHYEQLNFLFALGSGLEEMEKEYAFLFNVALYKKISFLDRNDAVDLITQPVQDCYLIEPSTQEKILQVTSGHPYYTQLLCHCLFNRWQQRQETSIEVDVQDVVEVLDEAMERGLAVLKHVWEESTPGEKSLMTCMGTLLSNLHQAIEANLIKSFWTKYDVSIPKKEIMKALKSLIARDIVLSRDVNGVEVYMFAVDLQRLWTKKYKRPEWVKEEIEGAIQAWSLKRYQPISRRVITVGLMGLIVAGGLSWLTRPQWLQIFSAHPPPTPTNSRPVVVIKTVTAVPTPSQPGLELHSHRFIVSVDPSGLLNNSPSAADNVKHQIQAQASLKGHRVGFVIVYGGAPDDSHVGQAQEIATKVIQILRTFDEEGFNKASYYDPLFSLGQSDIIVELDVYLYAQ